MEVPNHEGTVIFKSLGAGHHVMTEVNHDNVFCFFHFCLPTVTAAGLPQHLICSDGNASIHHQLKVASVEVASRQVPANSGIPGR